MASRPWRILSLCSGIGGLDIGVHAALGGNARTAAYVERETYCAAILKTRAEEGWICDAPIWADVKTFDHQPWRGRVDAVIGSYPCQGLSVAGKRKGESDDRWLWPDFARIIAGIRPQWCFFENVANHVNLGLKTVWTDLRGMGFDVEAGLFEAAEVGAPHIRRRLFILARQSGASIGAASGDGKREDVADAIVDNRTRQPSRGLCGARQCSGHTGTESPNDTAGGNEYVADACRIPKRHESREISSSQIEEQGGNGSAHAVQPAVGREDVANADSQSHASQPRGLVRGEKRLSSEEKRTRFNGGGEDVADAASQRREGRRAKQPSTQDAAAADCGQDVADAASLRCERRRAQQFESHDVAATHSGQYVADTDSQGRLQQRGPIGAKRGRAAHGGEEGDVANAQCQRGRKHPRAVHQTRRRSGGAGRACAVASENGGADVANHHSQRGGEEQQSAWRWVADLDWRSRWESSAGILRVASGIPNRLGQLRALGNAVVPECARFAFETLAQR